MNKDDQWVMAFAARLLKGDALFQKEADRSCPHHRERILNAFLCLVENKAPIPQELLEYIASGVQDVLKHRTPWPTNNKRSINEALVALVKMTDKRYPRKRPDIAAAVGASSRTVNNYCAAKWTSGIGLHLTIWESMYPAGTSLNDLLDSLEQVAKDTR